MTAGIAVETIGDRLARVAERVPGRIAIVEQGDRLDYRQLDADATAIARQIVAASRGRPGAVALLFSHKLPAIKSIFGAARSGHAYVPLDANDPEDRLRFILQDCAPIVLLTDTSLRDRACGLAPARCTVIDIDDAEPGDARSPLPPVDNDALVWLCYTSGSTGEPKGVGQTHRNSMFFTDAYATSLGVGEGDRLSLVYTMSFGAANNDVFRGLLHGATLCAYDLRRYGIPQLADWLDRERITVFHSVPTVFREMAIRLAPGRMLPHLRLVHLGGESVLAADVELFRRHTLEQCRMVNQLSATEAAIIAQNVVDHRDPTPGGGVLAVGRCVDGVQVEIRRGDGSIASPGEAGDVIVCSPHISPGYWRRPALDLAAFCDDPLRPGWRQYRSGDIGRIDEAGNLHFLGRRGSRVKIRGHSVDLAEIEAAISGCPEVAKAAVVASSGGAPTEQERLTAYVEMRDGAPRDPRVLRRHLVDRVPRYMLPAKVVFLDRLPLTASGKVDRSSLCRMDATPAAPDRAAPPPQDEVERAVAAVFAELLQLESVGRDDDFFLLGGDSLLGVELQVRLRETFGVHVGELHADAVVAGIAQSIRRAVAERAAGARAIPVLMPLWRSGSAPPLFLVHGRHGQAFVSPHFMKLLGNDQPVWVFQARGLDGLREPHSSVDDMAEEYLAEMLKHRPHGPYFIGALCAGAYVAAAMARRLRGAGEAVLPLLLLDPPNSVRQRGYSQLSEEQFVAKMKARGARGVTAGAVHDPGYIRALQRTALAFEDAIARHRPAPYDGPVYVLCSRQRMQESTELRTIYTGRVKRYEVGATHTQALDPRNPVFASTLLRCVRLILETAPAVEGEPEGRYP